MLFTRVASISFAFLTFGLVSYANPVVVKRATSPDTIVTDLQTKVNSITPQFQSITTNSPDNVGQAQSLVNELISAFNDVNTQASSGSLASLEKRQTAASVAAVLANVIEDTATVLTPLVVLMPALRPLVASMDIPLNSLVGDLDIVVVGLVNTLESILFGISGILRGLGWTQMSATLGF